MRKKLLVLLTIFCMTLTMMPSIAFAEDGVIEDTTLNTEDVSTETAENEEVPVTDNSDSAQSEEVSSDIPDIMDEEQASDEEEDETDEVFVEEEDLQENTELRLNAPDGGGTFSDGEKIKYKSGKTNAGGNRQVRTFTVTSDRRALPAKKWQDFPVCLRKHWEGELCATK